MRTRCNSNLNDCIKIVEWQETKSNFHTGWVWSALHCSHLSGSARNLPLFTLGICLNVRSDGGVAWEQGWARTRRFGAAAQGKSSSLVVPVCPGPSLALIPLLCELVQLAHSATISSFFCWCAFCSVSKLNQLTAGSSESPRGARAKQGVQSRNRTLSSSQYCALHGTLRYFRKT